MMGKNGNRNCFEIRVVGGIVCSGKKEKCTYQVPSCYRSTLNSAESWVPVRRALDDAKRRVANSHGCLNMRVAYQLFEKIF